jgi:tetratricopeptide (TPR) repeat protein
MTRKAIPPTRRRDVRPRLAIGILLIVFVLGGLLQWLGKTNAPAPDPAAARLSSPHAPGFSGLKADATDRGDVARLEFQEPAGSPAGNTERQARDLMRQAAAEIKKRQYDKAIIALTEKQPLLKNYPEAYLLMARALEGKRDYDTARDFYNAAANRDPYMADAYWGFATTSEKLSDLEGAIGGMRSFLHTEGGRDPYRLRVAQARSALWEWESQLGRGPWGPTKGVPPGFTTEEISRDGRGVGIKMQVAGSENAAKETRAEMKHQEKHKVYPR